MKKRLLSILLALALCLGLLPTVALAEGTDEQFDLTPGGTYWFDLSGESIFGTEILGTPNPSVPDASLHYVRFTYAGTVDAYVLNSSSSGQGGASGAASQTTDENAQYGYTYSHSLFVSDFVLTTGRSWDELNDEGLIFGRSYTSGSVDYTLRAPSVGCRKISSGGEPSNNEWDSVQNKKLVYIQCYVDDIYSWGQDSGSEWTRAARGLKNYPRAWGSTYSYYSRPANFGYRPFLEVLNTDELGPDGLKAVTLDLNGGSLGGRTNNIQIVVKNGATFTAPASEGLTRPDGDTGSSFFWLASDGKLYAPGASVPAGVTSLTAQWSSDEQFNLTPGGTYWFDLSGENIPGPVNEGNRDKEDPVPDTTLHYVPFTYAGTVDAYVLNSSSSEKTQAAQDASQTTEKNAQYGYTYPHSLFVSDYVLTHTYVGWAVLNEAGLIFGRSYTSGSVDYTLRAPSAGSSYTGSGDSMRGTPLNNEWDAVLNKDSGYIKYWNGVYSWGQDTRSDYYRNCAIRGSSTVRNWFSRSVYTSPSMYDGFRPVLEVLNPDELGPNGLKAVTLDLNGGSLGGSTDNIQIIVKNGATFTAPASEGLTRPDGDTGSSFTWQASDGTLYAPGASVPADVTLLTAQWGASTDPDTYTVSFNSQGGSMVNRQTVESGGTATEPTAPTREGYTFGGWYTDTGYTTEYDFTTPVTGNLILYAKWTLNQYTITFDTDGGTTIAPITQDYGSDVIAPANPTKTGYTFAGWDTTIPNTMPANNMTIKAKWTVNQYTITFDTDGGTTIAPITQDYGTAITAPENPTKTGYTFAGWEPELPETMPARDMTIKAKWTVNQYTITFDTDGGNTIDPITQDYGTAVTAPENPTKTGYTFNGWDKAIPDKMPAGNLTITAQWTVKPYTITYDLDGGTVEGNPDSYTVETVTFTLNNPTKRGYTFTGWSGTGLTGENNLTVTIETGSTGDRNYKAHWRYNVSYTPTYPITVESARHGDVTSSHKSASKGTTVTITVEPDKGYTLETITVTDASGNEIEPTNKGDGKYTFTMPASKVYVEATFMEDNSMLNFFVDVPASAYYYDAVLWAAENGITGGVDDTHFAPNAACTRAQAVTFLWRAAGSPAPKSNVNPFTDVKAGSYYYDAVLWAVENGITKGTSDTTFSPDATCTRGQIVSFLWRAFGSPAVSGSAVFTDVPAGSYYETAVLWAVTNGITDGTSATTFSPAANCTRDQIVTFLWRALTE